MPDSSSTFANEIDRLLAGVERVFPSHPQISRYFPSVAIEDARHRLSRAIDRGDGPGLVIGGPGTGKSLLLQVLAAQYQEHLDVVLLACSRLCTRRALLQAILFELGMPYRLRDEGVLRLSLLDHLLSSKNCPAGLLLLVDEAQSLSVALLDELRVMTNLVRGGVPRVRLVLAGSPALEESFTHPDLESFSQRLSARCYLAPFGREETAQYIRSQLAACGASPDGVFIPESFGAVFDATDGVPRLVNQLCDRALWFAQAKRSAQIDRHVIQAAWSDLQQLPTPWESPTSRAVAPASSHVVEFGKLTDEDAFTDEADIEPTDLDEVEDLAAILPEPDVQEPEVIPATLGDVDLRLRDQYAAPRVNDPFAEEFAEEEIVLDSFAAWDDAFGRHTPRVENRRDPGFAGLVQIAMDSSALLHAEASDVAAAPASSRIETVEPDADTQMEDRPTLRLAVVSEPAALTAIPLLPPDTSVHTIASGDFDPVLPDESAGWSLPTAHTRCDPLANTAPPTSIVDAEGFVYAADVESPPILVIEDDPIGPDQPPVRRESYRHLFSRLRSG